VQAVEILFSMGDLQIVNITDECISALDVFNLTDALLDVAPHWQLVVRVNSYIHSVERRDPQKIQCRWVKVGDLGLIVVKVEWSNQCPPPCVPALYLRHVYPVATYLPCYLGLRSTWTRRGGV